MNSVKVRIKSKTNECQVVFHGGGAGRLSYFNINTYRGGVAY